MLNDIRNSTLKFWGKVPFSPELYPEKLWIRMGEHQGFFIRLLWNNYLHNYFQGRFWKASFWKFVNKCKKEKMEFSKFWTEPERQQQRPKSQLWNCRNHGRMCQERKDLQGKRYKLKILSWEIGHVKNWSTIIQYKSLRRMTL